MNKDIEPSYQYTEYGNNTYSNNEDPAFLFIGVSTILCFYFCNIFFDIIKKKYKDHKMEQKLLLPINIEDIKEKKCSICLEEYNKGNNIIKLKCNHEYHKDCIKEWFNINKNCPQCRKNII